MAINPTNQSDYLNNMSQGKNPDGSAASAGQMAWANSQLQAAYQNAKSNPQPQQVDKITSTNYNPVTYPSSPVVAPIGVNDISQVNPYKGIDMNQVLGLNQTIMKAKQNYMNDPTGSAKQAADARNQLQQMGLGNDWIIGNGPNDPDPNQKFAQIQNLAKSASGLPNETVPDYYQGKVNDINSEMNDPNNPFWKSYHDMAQQQGMAQYNTQANSINGLIAQLKAQQQSALSGIQNGVADSQQALNDKTFQNYLKARESMASRGMAGSGLENDANTRLMLQKQQDLAGVMRDAATRTDAANAEYGGKLSQAQQQLAALNPQSMIDSLFQNYYKQGQTSLAGQATNYTNMLKGLMPYQMPTQGDTLKNNIDQQKVNLDTGKAIGMINIDGKNVPTEQAIADNKKYSLDYSKALGYLAGPDGKLITDNNGNPIPLTDTNKLNEQIRHDKATEANQNITANAAATNAGANLMNAGTNANKLTAQVAQWTEENRLKAGDQQIKKDELSHQIDKDTAMINNARNKLSPQDKAQIDILKTRLNNITSQLNSNRNSLNPDGTVAKQLQSDYQATVGQVEKILKGANFNMVPEGGAYTNLYKTQSLGGEMNNNYQNVASSISKALQSKGMPQEWLPYIMELTGRESSWDPNARNPSSSASGLFQFLNKTWGDYGATKTSDPYQQALAGLDYIKSRYGDPIKALQFWDKNNWY